MIHYTILTRFLELLFFTYYSIGTKVQMLENKKSKIVIFVIPVPFAGFC